VAKLLLRKKPSKTFCRG